MATTGTKATNLIERALCLYNDPKGERFGAPKLLSFLNEAVAEVAGARPSQFTEVISVQLQAGALQSLPFGYCFIKVDGVSASDTETTATVGPQLDTVMAQRFGGEACRDRGADPEDYVPQAATGVSFSPSMFEVSPPAPEGVTTSVDVVATNSTPATLLGGDCSPLPAVYDAQLVDFMLYRMHSIQIESAFHVAQAQRYCDKFYGGLNADYQSASRVKSGFNYGRTGEGNANLGAQRDLRGVVL